MAMMKCFGKVAVGKAKEALVAKLPFAGNIMSFFHFRRLFGLKDIKKAGKKVASKAKGAAVAGAKKLCKSQQGNIKKACDAVAVKAVDAIVKKAEEAAKKMGGSLPAEAGKKCALAFTSELCTYVSA